MRASHRDDGQRPAQSGLSGAGGLAAAQGCRTAFTIAAGRAGHKERLRKMHLGFPDFSESLGCASVLIVVALPFAVLCGTLDADRTRTNNVTPKQARCWRSEKTYHVPAKTRTLSRIIAADNFKKSSRNLRDRRHRQTGTSKPRGIYSTTAD